MGKPNAIDQIPSPEWAKHLRPRGKRKYHRKVRQKVRRELARQKDDAQ